MYTFSVEERIYAAFDIDHSPDWRDQNKFDASPAGLSGKIEGFYFANWLMPFRVPFILCNVAISPTNFPVCLESDDYKCMVCQFFNISICPILLDKDNFDLTRKGFEIYQKLVYCPRCDSFALFEAVQKELLTHGRDLHYFVISRIVQDRYPKLSITPSNIHKVLHNNPLFFKDLGDGVYHAIPSITPSKDHPISILFAGLF
ncbi:MAG: hypothetical protein ABFD50_15750 [Smithella sp.]